MLIATRYGRFTAVVAGAVAASALALGSPASAATVQPADVVCNLSSNADLYLGMTHAGGDQEQFTLHAGRGFHSYQRYFSDDGGREWVYGYGAEHPGTDGWILLRHAPGC